MEQKAVEPQAETITEGTGGVPATKPEKLPAQLIARDGGVLPIIPRNIEEAQRYANGLIAANIVPDAFRFSDKEARAAGDMSLRDKPNAPLILMGVLQAMELGVAPQSGLKWLLPLRGRFTIWGDLAIALAQRQGLVANQTVAWVGPAFDESMALGEWPLDFGCEVRLWRVGQQEPYIGRFLVRDAKRANLWMSSNKQPWVDYPKRMLFNRARAFALRDGFADALNGLSLAEEVMDFPEEATPEKPGADISALEADVIEEPAEETGDEQANA